MLEEFCKELAAILQAKVVFGNGTDKKVAGAGGAGTGAALVGIAGASGAGTAGAGAGTGAGGGVRTV